MVEQSAGPPRRLDLGILIGLAYQGFTAELRAALAAQGFRDLGGAYGYVFRAVVDREPSQRELAQGLGITDQGMAKIVAEMVARGYLERRADPLDRRIKRLRLAGRGRAALRAARRFHASFERRLARSAGGAAVRTLRRLLAVTAGGGEAALAKVPLRPF
jgi:DNA-binding MarR family transcriptional regulator